VVGTRPAFAGPKVAIDVGATFPAGASNHGGFGVGARFGHEYKLTLLELTPELGLAYHDFGGPADATAIAGFAGGRFGVNLGLEPLVFAHAGVGHFSSVSRSNTSLAYDVGGALDLTILPVVSFGAHAMVAGIAGTSSVNGLSWVELGGHVSFSVGE
jgi:hypothetical protein